VILNSGAIAAAGTLPYSCSFPTTVTYIGEYGLIFAGFKTQSIISFDASITNITTAGAIISIMVPSDSSIMLV